MEILNVDVTEVARVQATNHTSKGNQPKWQVKNKWLKADHMGYEALAEVLISSLLEKTNVPEFVSYQPALIQYHDKTLTGCASDNFRKEHEELIPVERLHRAYCGPGLAQVLGKAPSVESAIQYTVDFIEKQTKLTDFGAYLTTILELDQLFLNEDRHTNNIAVIWNNKTESYRLCPIFDNGLSLLSDTKSYLLDEDFYNCIKRVQAKPFFPSYEEQTEAANRLYGSFLKCYFKHSDVTAILDSMEPMYPTKVLRRVERIVFEQMRRYRIYFE